MFFNNSYRKPHIIIIDNNSNGGGFIEFFLILFLFVLALNYLPTLDDVVPTEQSEKTENDSLKNVNRNDDVKPQPQKTKQKTKQQKVIVY